MEEERLSDTNDVGSRSVALRNSEYSLSLRDDILVDPQVARREDTPLGLEGEEVLKDEDEGGASIGGEDSGSLLGEAVGDPVPTDKLAQDAVADDEEGDSPRAKNIEKSEFEGGVTERTTRLAEGNKESPVDEDFAEKILRRRQFWAILENTANENVDSDTVDWTQDTELLEGLNQVLAEVKRVFSINDIEFRVDDGLRRLIPILQEMGTNDGKSLAAAQIETKIDENGEEIRSLKHVVKQAEERNGKAQEDREYLQMEQRLEELRFDLVVTHREVAELQAKLKETIYRTQRKHKELLEKENRMNELSTPKVNEFVRKLENYPRELTQLRRDLEKAELDLMKDECELKEITRSIQSAEGAKRRSHVMSDRLRQEIARLNEREKSSDVDASAAEETLDFLELEYERSRNEARRNTEDLIKRMQELYDIQDAVLKEIKGLQGNKILRGISSRATSQTIRMRHVLLSLANPKDESKKPDKESPASEPRKRVEELGQILSEKDDYAKRLEKEIDDLTKKISTAERALDLARQERIKNARNLTNDNTARVDMGPRRSSQTNDNKDFMWIN
eukprot:CAMPEP_0184752608 /NCGR_PEP_ID=MMETSP0315-20130426/43666_1 /TAXON_ID=101924 /ORGANISM="Rhodosorus marinus, Strain UTEX LB 2760" /LENGTH=564 /DNA_ID=CAMNT_0027231947 /DNA_START=749 /DNA_END=2443 /DNA_ORIENTATION=-